MPKLAIAMSETHQQPRFASHTQSSLMKARTPMKLKKKLSLRKDVNESKKSQGTIIFRSNGIRKRRNSIIKQRKSMQMLITILKQQRDRRTTGFLNGSSELVETTCLLENSCISLPSDLINDISCDLKKCTGSPAKLASTIRSKLTKVVDEHVNLQISFQDEINCEERDNSEDSLPSYNSSEDQTITNVACKLQLHLSDEEEPMNWRHEDEVHQRPTESENFNDIPNKVGSEVQVHLQNANVTTNRKRFRKYWLKNKKVSNQSQHVDNPQNNLSTKERPIINVSTTTRKKDTLEKNPASNQRAWKPPGVSKTWVAESTTSLQSMSQKSSQSVRKFTTSTKSKHASIEYINKSTSASVSANQTKILMKENRDPRANRMTKICDHLTETKQRQILQGEGALPKTKRSKTKISKVQRDNANLQSPSKSRHSQTPPFMLMESSNIEPQCAESIPMYKRRTRTLEVMHTLKEIIDNVKGNEDTEKSAVKNDDYDHETNSEIPTSPNCDTLQSNDIYTKDVNLNKVDQLSRKSIGTQTELDIPSRCKIDAEKVQDGTFEDKTFKVLTKLLKLTQSVATQTSSSYNKNIVDIGCNTSNNDVEVSYDLISFTNLETKVNPTTIEDKLISVPTSVKHVGINDGSKNTNENADLLLAKCEKTLNIQMSLKLENCDNMEITAESTNAASEETEKIMHEKICQNFLQSPKNFNDKTSTDINKQESTKCFSNHGASSTSVNNLERLSICDYDATCSSKKVAKCFENDEDSSKLKMEYIPSVIAAFELAAERGRNLREAVIIYYKNLMSKVSEKRNEETVDDCETSKHYDFEKCASFKSRENEDYKIELNTKDYSGMSSYSSDSSDLISDSEYQKLLKELDTYLKEESDIFSGEEEAVTNLNVNKRSELEDMKSLVCRAEDEYALELLEKTSEDSDESFEMENLKNGKILALPSSNKETSLISRANLLPLICCVICTVIFWCLQFSFRCDSTK
ncbi:uncharacterized protein LOC105207625 [Solenopsis invicta]|uniref:uncharacterized protein LOC105207625 n=1 Tax=Solenopsis invicta TaxID=13686 RepID=UPI00193E6BD3|nr:uncharacterized protein LOC105207625 [Solenopsis invicta]